MTIGKKRPAPQVRRAKAPRSFIFTANLARSFQAAVDPSVAAIDLRPRQVPHPFRGLFFELRPNS